MTAKEKLVSWELLQVSSLLAETGSESVEKIISACGYDPYSTTDIGCYREAYKEACNRLNEWFYSEGAGIVAGPGDMFPFQSIVRNVFAVAAQAKSSNKFNKFPEQPLINDELIQKWKSRSALRSAAWISNSLVITAIECGYWDRNEKGEINVYILAMLKALYISVDSNGKSFASEALLLLVDLCKKAHSKLNSYDLAELISWSSAIDLARSWYSFFYGDQKIESPLVALDSYLVDAPIYLNEAQIAQIIEWYRIEIVEPLHMKDYFKGTKYSFEEIIKDAAIALDTTGDMNSGQYQDLWKKAVREHWKIGQQPCAFTCDQAISAVATYITQVAQTFDKKTTNPNQRLVGAKLIEYYREHKDNQDEQQVAEGAGYKFYLSFESMYQRALGKLPLPITKDQDGDEWRNAITNLCTSVPLEIRFKQIANSSNSQLNDSIEKVLRDIINSINQSIVKSIKYEKVFAHTILRRYTYAFFAAQIDGQYSEERFDSIYREPILVYIDDVVSESVTYEEIESNILIIKKLQPYIRLFTQIFTNYLVNLLGREQIEVMPENNDYFVQWKNMHSELENNGYYDEIFLIRQQMIQAFIAIEGSMLMDDEARSGFNTKAWNLLNQYDLKGKMQSAIAKEKLVGNDLLEAIFISEESGSSMLSEVMNRCGYDHMCEEDLKEFWEERKAIEEKLNDFVEMIEIGNASTQQQLIGNELIEKYKSSVAIGHPIILAAVACGYYEKTPSGKINVFITKLCDALDNAGYDKNYSIEEWAIWLKDAPSEPLTGNELLEKVRCLGDVNKTELVVRCGYFKKVETGKVISYVANFTDFYYALLHAKGISLETSEVTTDTPSPMDTINEDVIEFAGAIARITRRTVLQGWYGVEKFSEYDESEFQRALNSANECLSRLGTHQFGIHCLSLIKQVVIRTFSYDGPADQDVEDRIDQLSWMIDALVNNANIFENETLDEIADRNMSNTTDYSKSVAHSLVALLRTEVHNHFHDAEWHLTEEYEKDLTYTSEQLAFLDRGNCPSLFTAAVFSSMSAICMNPLHDELDLTKLKIWVIERVTYLMKMFPEDQKAQGRYGSWI